MSQGEPNNRITFTKSEPAAAVAPVWPSDIRLVDDFSVHVGRLQVMYKHKWRGICANHRKYAHDSHLAVSDAGRSYKWTEKVNNYHHMPPFNGHFPGEPALARSLGPPCPLFGKRSLWINGTCFTV